MSFSDDWKKLVSAAPAADTTAPAPSSYGRAKPVARAPEAAQHAPEPLVEREQVVETETDRLASADGWRPLPEHDSAARSLMRTCREYGVGLRVDPDGTLVVESNGKAWQSLVRAITAHADAIATLIESGWPSFDA
jgi:hypothetical protein